MKVTAAYIEQLIRDYQSAYTDANEATAPAVTWSRGWFTIGRPSARYRRKALEEMRDELRRRASILAPPTRSDAAE
jgi:hypothetical protein